jgi:hypothetical protein
MDEANIGRAAAQRHLYALQVGSGVPNRASHARQSFPKGAHEAFEKGPGRLIEIFFACMLYQDASRCRFFRARMSRICAVSPSSSYLLAYIFFPQ